MSAIAPSSFPRPSTEDAAVVTPPANVTPPPSCTPVRRCSELTGVPPPSPAAAGLNEALVRYLMERDEQHMEQDSKLVHIEDLTSYFGQKHQDAPPPQPPPPPAADAKRKPLRIGLGRAK